MKLLLKGAVMIAMTAGFAAAARPFRSDDAGTVPAAGYELEAGYDLGEELGAVGVGFKHGLTEKMDIGVGFGFNIVTEPKNSFTGSGLSLKYALVPGFLAASFATEIGGSAYVLNGILTRCFGAAEIDGNFGYATGDSSVTYALAAVYSAGALAFGTEISGDRETESWLAGLRYAVRDGLAVDAGFTSDFDLDAKALSVGFHWEF
jgi:hypothetical protein